MIFNIYRRKCESQEGEKCTIKILIGLLVLYIIHFTFYIQPALAVVDPLASPNNKFGVHIISTTPHESSPAAQLVNSSGGDWGYVTVLIERKDKDQAKWQEFFNDLRRRHLIPLVRLATEPTGNVWKLPDEGEEKVWADFLDSLIWPTKNRYVVIYNEPNQGQEWEGAVNARSYAQVLDKTITALKSKSADFFILNAGFDASAPPKIPSYQDEVNFLQEMNKEVPGIFDKLDGWVSHSYPNPGFVGSPNAFGRGTVRGWQWELALLNSLGVEKSLPVFITETGWKHAEGIDYDKSLPPAEVVGKNFQKAFQEAWSDGNIVAVTPFLLNYQEPPFDHFSFKKLTGEPQNLKILGAAYPDYYPHYKAVMDLSKVAGKPVQEDRAQLVAGDIYRSLVAGESYAIPFTFKNTGQSIWSERPVEFRAILGQTELGIAPVKLADGVKVEPGQEASFNLHLTAPQSGIFTISLQLFNNNQAFGQDPFIFNTQVKSPVILLINSGLNYKKSAEGDYFLEVTSNIVKSVTKVYLNSQGKSEELTAKFLLPDQTFQFTLSKPFYKPRTISSPLQSGINELDFGKLEPDFFSALVKPQELWRLLPFSN